MLSSCYLAQGDVLRYRTQVEGEPLMATVAAMRQAYHTSTQLAPGRGAPYNQLGVLSATNLAQRSDPLEAVYFYVLAISAPEPFPQAAANLKLFLQQLTARKLPDRAGPGQKARHRCVI